MSAHVGAGDPARAGAPARSGLALLTVLLLAGCGTDPGDVRREHVAGVTSAANDGDAEQVRQQADALMRAVADQRRSGDIDAQEAERLTALATAVQRSADVIDAELLERRRAEAETEAERKRLEEERKRLEEERKRLEEERRKADEGKGKDDDKDEDKKDEDKDKD